MPNASEVVFNLPSSWKPSRGRRRVLLALRVEDSLLDRDFFAKTMDAAGSGGDVKATIF